MNESESKTSIGRIDGKAHDPITEAFQGKVNPVVQEAYQRQWEAQAKLENAKRTLKDKLFGWSKTSPEQMRNQTMSQFHGEVQKSFVQQPQENVTQEAVTAKMQEVAKEKFKPKEPQNVRAEAIVEKNKPRLEEFVENGRYQKINHLIFAVSRQLKKLDADPEILTNFYQQIGQEIHAKMLSAINRGQASVLFGMAESQAFRDLFKDTVVNTEVFANGIGEQSESREQLKEDFDQKIAETYLLGHNYTIKRLLKFGEQIKIITSENGKLLQMPQFKETIAKRCADRLGLDVTSAKNLLNSVTSEFGLDKAELLQLANADEILAQKIATALEENNPVRAKYLLNSATKELGLDRAKLFELADANKIMAQKIARRLESDTTSGKRLLDSTTQEFGLDRAKLFELADVKGILAQKIARRLESDTTSVKNLLNSYVKEFALDKAELLQLANADETMAQKIARRLESDTTSGKRLLDFAIKELGLDRAKLFELADVKGILAQKIANRLRQNNKTGAENLLDFATKELNIDPAEIKKVFEDSLLKQA